MNQHLYQAHQRAFNVASAMPLQHLQKVRALTGHLVASANSWDESKKALQELNDRQALTLDMQA